LNIFTQIKLKFGTALFKNSAWGIVANVLQNILLSVFFIVLARQYSTEDFAQYIIANTVYSFIVGFSTLGLGHWFIRELINTDDKSALIDKFFKMQLYVGVIFYVLNILMANMLYESPLVRSLSVIIGINVIFDNLIYVIKYINIANEQQRKSFTLLTIEALLKCIVAGSLLFYPIPILYLSVILIALRLITLNMFVRFGSSNLVSLQKIIKARVNWKEIRGIIVSNWSFIIIGSISVIYWRIGSILVSKKLTLEDVAHYEVSFKLLSMAYILPVIVSSSIYPILLKAYKEDLDKMKSIYHKAFIAFALYGLLAYTFIYAYADWLIPLLFGEKYLATPQFCKEMFLVMLVFPTVFLQANVLITLKLEKLDMVCNAASLVLNVLLCLIGFQFEQSLTVVNIAIFISFFAFHLIQDVVLVRKKIVSFRQVFLFYLISALIVLNFHYLCNKWNPYLLFFLFWGIIILCGGAWFFYKRKTINSSLLNQ
jgi:O-antigen/teichoic acid export membrane protein